MSSTQTTESATTATAQHTDGITTSTFPTMDQPKATKPGPSSTKDSKHRTQVQFDISNKTSLADIAKRFNPVNPPPEAPAPKLKSSYFEKLDMAIRMELDHGTQHIIDVQPDLRFPFQFFIYNDLTVKSHPFVSTFTLIAYQQILFNAYILICDLYSTEMVSYYASFYKNNSQKMDF